MWIKWEYDDFYDWCAKHYNKKANLATKINTTFLHMKKYDKKQKVGTQYKIDTFIHSPNNSIISQIVGTTSRLCPMGLYCFMVNRKSDRDMKRVYFLFPKKKSNSGSTVGRNSPIIADHFTFMLSQKPNTLPIDCHVTLYIPSGFTVFKGIIDREQSFIDKTLEIDRNGYNDAAVIFKDLTKKFAEAALDIIRAPLLPQTQPGGAKFVEAQPKSKPTSKSNSNKRVKSKKVKIPTPKKPQISKELQVALASKNISEVLAFGIKLPASSQISFTVFLTEELSESDYESDSSYDDSLDYVNPLYSFVFLSDKYDFKTIEKAIIDNIKKQK